MTSNPRLTRTTPSNTEVLEINSSPAKDEPLSMRTREPTAGPSGSGPSRLRSCSNAKLRPTPSIILTGSMAGPNRHNTGNPTSATAMGKGKAKAKPPIVIELSDSSDEEPEVKLTVKRVTRSQSRQPPPVSRSVDKGKGKGKPAPAPSKTAALSPVQENLHTTNGSAHPLFLPAGGSDEENVPPSHLAQRSAPNDVPKPLSATHSNFGQRIDERERTPQSEPRTLHDDGYDDFYADEEGVHPGIGGAVHRNAAVRPEPEVENVFALDEPAAADPPPQNRPDDAPHMRPLSPDHFRGPQRDDFDEYLADEPDWAVGIDADAWHDPPNPYFNDLVPPAPIEPHPFARAHDQGARHVNNVDDPNIMEIEGIEGVDMAEQEALMAACQQAREQTLHDPNPAQPVTAGAAQALQPLPAEPPVDVDAIADAATPQAAHNPDPLSAATAAILEIIPDVEPAHLMGLINEHMPTHGPEGVVAHVLNWLFGDGKGYPKIDRKGKGKRKASEDGDNGTQSKRRKVAGFEDAEGYLDANRRGAGGVGQDYRDLALHALQTDFPYIPVPFLRKVISEERGYARTFQHLWRLEHPDEAQQGAQARPLPYIKKTLPSQPNKGKGKRKAWDDYNGEFERERTWVMAFKTHLESTQAPATEEVEPVQDEEDPNGIQCGCCFTSFHADVMTQCPDGHTFCRGCLVNMASIQLGSQKCEIKCMFSEGDPCTRLFTDSELKKWLDPKLFKLYEKLKQQKELKEAGLENLEECPFCDWACVMDAPKEVDKVFRCGNDECEEISCRLCKKREHLPKSCKEAEEDQHVDKRVLIEEAMTKALIRNCPKCSKAFLKESGCNKMTCPECRTLSCYVCKQQVTGYDHFNQNTGPNQRGGSSRDGKKCPLWDAVDQRHDAEVKQAYEAAVKEVQAENPDVEMGKDIKVDLPPPPPPAPKYPAGYVHPGMFAAAGAIPRIVPPPPPPRLPANMDPAPLRQQLAPLQARQHQLIQELRRQEASLAQLANEEAVLHDKYKSMKARLLLMPSSVEKDAVRSEHASVRARVQRVSSDKAAANIRVQNLRQSLADAVDAANAMLAEIRGREVLAAQWHAQQDAERRIQQEQQRRNAQAIIQNAAMEQQQREQNMLQDLQLRMQQQMEQQQAANQARGVARAQALAALAIPPPLIPIPNPLAAVRRNHGGPAPRAPPAPKRRR